LGKKIAFILLIVFFVSTTAAQAQDTPSFETITIDLWPEYDRESLLVIYKAELSPEITLPVDVTLRIPVEADGESVLVYRVRYEW